MEYTIYGGNHQSGMAPHYFFLCLSLLSGASANIIEGLLLHSSMEKEIL